MGSAVVLKVIRLPDKFDGRGRPCHVEPCDRRSPLIDAMQNSVVDGFPTQAGQDKMPEYFPRDISHISSVFLRDTRLASRQVAGKRLRKIYDQEAFVRSSLRFDWLLQGSSEKRSSLACASGYGMGIGFRWLGLCFLVGVLLASPLKAQDVDPEEAKEKSVADRFVTVLEKNPRRGTALDKVYGFHVERGSLDGLVKNYRDKTQTAKGVDAGTAWMIVGLLESLRGQDAVAVDAFEHAEQLVKDNYLASYYLGQSLVLIGQPDKAAEALERSIQRKPAQADLLDIFQALGRVYQRAQKTDKALEVWNRLEKQFPNDARVQEQIATTLLEENEFAAALPRFQGLAKTTKDKYRQSLFQMEAAEIKVRLGKSDEAIAEFEKLLGQLNPDNWLYREVRRRIEAVYLRTDDQSGLITYYETWIKKNAEDLEAVSRLSRLLAGMGRGPEA